MCSIRPTRGSLGRASGRSRGRARKLATLVGETRRRVRDRSRAMGRTAAGDHPDDPPALRGGARREVLRADRADRASCWSARSREAQTARGHRAPERARGRGAKAKLKAAASARGARGSLREGRRADQAARGRRADHRSARVAVRPGRPADPQGQARQAERVRVRRADLRGDREHQARRARVDPAGLDTKLGNPAEDTLLPDTVSRARSGSGSRPREVALDGGVQPGPTNTRARGPRARADVHRRPPGTRLADEPSRRLPRYRTGAEGRISHLKRRYGLRPIPPQGRPRDADLDRMGDPRLQPRHPRHPNPLKHSTTLDQEQHHLPGTAASIRRGRFGSQPSPFIRGK